MQQQLDSVSMWCHDSGSFINPDKTQTLWCTLDSRAAGKQMPAVVFDGAVVKRTSHLRYFGIHFDRMLRLQKTRRNNSTEVQERSVSPDGYATSSSCIKVWCSVTGAGIAQWLERRTRDRKVAGSNPCRSSGRIFFSRVTFLC